VDVVGAEGDVAEHGRSRAVGIMLPPSGNPGSA
jgi:hypothetical protein